MTNSGIRVERDSMGEVQVPMDALYGASTARAVENFPVSGRPLPVGLIRAIGLVKQVAARVNAQLGYLPAEVAEAIATAAGEVAAGRWDDQFPVDVFQTGSGTSSNMNANEVIANRAAVLLGHAPGSRVVHPNDHVNLGQSSNDVFPTAIHLAVLVDLRDRLDPALGALATGLEAKVRQFWDIVKLGRTHLMDATPIRLGQEFGGYATQVRKGLGRLQRTREGLLELPLGGTAVGTGINTHPEFGRLVSATLGQLLDLPLREADNHFEAQGARDALLAVSAEVRGVAVALARIANDIRMLGSGPRAGIGELVLPAVQPGSSIMPGKVNPVICESVIQVAAQVVGHDAAICIGNQGGAFELNAMMPMMAANLLESIRLLANVVQLFADRCIAGLQANPARCAELLEGSLALVTALVPRIGYDLAAEIATEAWETGKAVREVAMVRAGLPREELERLLDPRAMCAPDADRVGSAGG